jgi:hypothetical protein
MPLKRNTELLKYQRLISKKFLSGHQTMINNLNAKLEDAFKRGYIIGRNHGYIVGVLTTQTSTATSIKYIGIVDTQDIIDIEMAVNDMAMQDDVREIRITQMQQVREIADIKGDIKLLNQKVDSIADKIDKKAGTKRFWVGIIVTAVLAGLLSNLPEIITAIKSLFVVTPY